MIKGNSREATGKRLFFVSTLIVQKIDFIDVHWWGESIFLYWFYLLKSYHRQGLADKEKKFLRTLKNLCLFTWYFFKFPHTLKRKSENRGTEKLGKVRVRYSHKDMENTSVIRGLRRTHTYPTTPSQLLGCGGGDMCYNPSACIWTISSKI